MPQNVQLSDVANAVLDAYVLDKSVPGATLPKGETASTAVIGDLFTHLSPEMQAMLLKKFPELRQTHKPKK